MDYLKELQAIEKANQEAKIQKAKLEQRLEQLQDELKKIQEELKELNVEESTLDKTIETLQIDIENDIEACKAELI